MPAAEAAFAATTLTFDTGRVLVGDCLTRLRELPDASVDAVVCDPPYGLSDLSPEQTAQVIAAWVTGDAAAMPTGRGFMGKGWDAFVPPPALWAQVLRVLKPGGHALVFAGSRTVDLMGLSLRLAGFEVRDTLHWMYGSGFPKSLDVSKAIDKRGGADIAWFGPWLRDERRRRGISSNALAKHFPSKSGGETGCVRNWELGLNLPTPDQFNKLVEVLDLPLGTIAEAQREVVGKVSGTKLAVAPGQGAERPCVDLAVTAPATDAAQRWAGWGTALKPGHEPIVVARKPLAGTVAATVLEHGTGGLNIDACRVGSEVRVNQPAATLGNGQTMAGGAAQLDRASSTAAGRWPANVLLTHAADCGQVCAGGCPVTALDAQSGTSKSPTETRTSPNNGTQGGLLEHGTRSAPTRTIQGHGDAGGASRFFPTTGWSADDEVGFRYCAKPGKKERNAGLDNTGANVHPTVKPVAVMRWLIRLVTPAGGLVLDPFLGSGTTAVAAIAEGVRWVGCEMTADYLPIIDGRVCHAEASAAAVAPEQLDLLDGALSD